MNNIDSQFRILLLKMLFLNQIINRSTYEKVLKKYRREEMV